MYPSSPALSLSPPFILKIPSQPLRSVNARFSRFLSLFLIFYLFLILHAPFHICIGAFPRLFSPPIFLLFLFHDRRDSASLPSCLLSRAIKRARGFVRVFIAGRINFEIFTRTKIQRKNVFLGIREGGRPAARFFVSFLFCVQCSMI